jgi:hypothetical protein
VAAWRLGLALEITHIDTAELYGDAEEMVAEAIAGRREEVEQGTVEACPTCGRAMRPAHDLFHLVMARVRGAGGQRGGHARRRGAVPDGGGGGPGRLASLPSADPAGGR